MKAPIIFSIVILVSTIFPAGDVRSQVADRKSDAQLTRRIDPDNSIYGIPFGTTVDEFISRCGKPDRAVTGGGKLTMRYGRSHAFRFDHDKLVAVRITQDALDWKSSSAPSDTDPFDSIKWQLSNGVENEMTLLSVKNILGERLLPKRVNQFFYRTEKAEVELAFAYYPNEGDGDTARKVYRIRVKQGTIEPDETWSGINDVTNTQPALDLHKAAVLSWDLRTPFRSFDETLVAAIQARWDNLLDAAKIDNRAFGKVVLEFRLQSDGQITDLRVATNEVNQALGLLCQKAVLESAPYAPWPSDMRRAIGKNYRSVTFTFHYGGTPAMRGPAGKH